MSNEEQTKKSTHRSGGRDVILRIGPEFAALVDAHKDEKSMGRYEAAEDLIRRGANRKAALSTFAQREKERRAARRAAKVK